MFYFTKTETEIIKIKVDFRDAIEYRWSPSTAYDSGDYVRPSVGNGFEYECTTAGQTNATEPSWPTTAGSTVTNGSVVWTARAFATNAADTISSANVEVPTGITAGTPSVDGTVIIVAVSGGENGNTYLISIEATTSAGELFEEKITVTIAGE